MLNDRVTREQAIAAAETAMESQGYSHGPCLTARQLVSAPVPVWEIEWAHKGCTGPSPTTDPSTIEVQVSIDGDDIRLLEPGWNRPRD